LMVSHVCRWHERTVTLHAVHSLNTPLRNAFPGSHARPPPTRRAQFAPCPPFPRLLTCPAQQRERTGPQHRSPTFCKSGVAHARQCNSRFPLHGTPQLNPKGLRELGVTQKTLHISPNYSKSQTGVIFQENKT